MYAKGIFRGKDPWKGLQEISKQAAGMILSLILPAGVD